MRVDEGPKEGRRLTALLMVLINILATIVGQYLVAGYTAAELQAQYNTLFRTAGFSVIAWGVTCFSFLIYAFYQLLPSQLDDPLHDRIARPLAVANLLGAAWVITYRMNLIWLTVAFALCMLILSLVMYVWVRNAVLRCEQSPWLSVPFSMFAGWSSVATITCAFLLFNQLGLGGFADQVMWTGATIFLLATLGIFVYYRCRDFIFPAVISSACVSIFVDLQSSYPYLGMAALTGAFLQVFWMVITLIKQLSYRHRADANKLSFSDTFMDKIRRHKLA